VLSRQSPPTSVPIRPLTATASATAGFVYASHKETRSPLPEPSYDPGLAAIIDAWPTLPEPIRAGILAMVKAARS
jgi:hypothetical protein